MSLKEKRGKQHVYITWFSINNISVYDVGAKNVQAVGAEDVGINSVRPEQNEWQFADSILKCISLNENVWILITV